MQKTKDKGQRTKGVVDCSCPSCFTRVVLETDWLTDALQIVPSFCGWERKLDRLIKWKVCHFTCHVLIRNPFVVPSITQFLTCTWDTFAVAPFSPRLPILPVKSVSSIKCSKDQTEYVFLHLKKHNLQLHQFWCH